MAINFEAANMAGYNNPKIEVFKADVSADGATLAQYPNKDTILNCISRGSIPFILLNNSAAGAQCLLTLHDILLVEDSVAIDFTAASALIGEHAISYPLEPNGVPQYVTSQ